MLRKQALAEMGKKKKAKAAQDNGQAGGAGGATAMQVEAVVVGAHCAELYPSLILRVGPESQLLFQAGAGLQRYWYALALRRRFYSSRRTDWRYISCAC